MTVAEVLYTASKLLGENDLASFLSGKIPDDAAYCEETAALLKDCYDRVVDEMACEYYPLLKCEKLQATDGKIFYSDFSEKPVRIVDVKDKNGKKATYRALIDRLAVNEGEVEVVYEYKIGKQKLTDAVVYADGVIGEYVLAYGIAAEFCFQRGRTQDADIWNEKYSYALRARLADKRRLKIKARKFV